MKRITITAELIKEEEGGYTVYCPELDIYTQGDDVEGAIKNLKEAAELHIEELGIEFKLGASPSSSLCHCQALTLSSLRGALRLRGVAEANSERDSSLTLGTSSAISRNVQPLGLPRLRLAMTEKRGSQ